MRDSERRLEEHRQDERLLSENIRRAKEELEQTSGPIQKQRSEIDEAECLLRGLARDRGSQDAGFPERMPQLLKAIQQEKSFTSAPVGPIGQHVRLLKPEWSSILENSLGGTLNSFIVTSKRDMNILSSVMQRLKWLGAFLCDGNNTDNNASVCPIFIGTEGAIDTTAFEPDARFDTVLSILEVRYRNLAI